MSNKIVAYDFGARLQEVRNLKGYSQKEASAYIDKHVNTYAKYESNTLDPPMKVLKKLAILFNTSIDYIMGLHDNPPLCLYDLTVEEYEAIMGVYKQFQKKNDTE